MPKLLFLLAALATCFTAAWGQLTSLTEVQDLGEGMHTFNFGNGDFDAYVDSDGWVLWQQYHHMGGTNPGLNVIPPGGNLPDVRPVPTWM